MIQDMEELGRITSEFRGRFNLSKARAAKALDVSVNYIRSLEAGVDITTGLPFKPREATLRHLAARMNEYAQEKGSTFSVTFAQLKIAAGLGLHEEPDAIAEMPELGRPSLVAIAGGLDVPEDATEPPDEWELEVLTKTGALQSHDYSREGDFWYLPREDRRALLRHLEDVWYEDQRLRKRMAERKRPT